MAQSTFEVPEHLQSLVSTFAEMMTGESTPENIEIILQWSLYMHIRSVMPPLVQHWGQLNPDDAEKVKASIKQLQALNEQWKAQRKQKEEE